jgi:hypothetical protein
MGWDVLLSIEYEFFARPGLKPEPTVAGLFGGLCGAGVSGAIYRRLCGRAGFSNLGVPTRPNRLEAEAGRNLEWMWLLRGVRPEFKTIADFRKDNLAAFRPLFKPFNLLCRKPELFGAELVAIDGCKFGAVNNCRRHYT